MESVAVILGVGTKGLPKFRFRHCPVDTRAVTDNVASGNKCCSSDLPTRFPQLFSPSLSRKERHFATNQMESLDVPSSVLDFRFRKKLVAYKWRRRSLRPRTRLFPPGLPCTCACPPSINSIPLTSTGCDPSIRCLAQYGNCSDVLGSRQKRPEYCGPEGLNQLMSDMENKMANLSALLVYDVSRWGGSKTSMRAPITNMSSRE
jgi:hypothetical protein